MDLSNYTIINAQTVDGWVKAGWKWGTPITHEEYLQALAGTWTILLTPTRPMPRSWLPEDLSGLKVLGLASGGGQQMPVLAALGASCTVLDYSERQLESERVVAAREGYDIACVRADMSLPLPFAEKLPSSGSSTDIPKNPYTTEGMPASRLMTAEKTPLSFFGQKREMNTAVKKPKIPPTASAPTVATREPTIILNTP